MSKMKRYQAKDGFVTREIAGETLLVPVGTRTRDFNGVISLNSTGAFIWEQLAEPMSETELLKAVTDEFEIDDDKALNDIRGFLQGGIENDLIFTV